MDHDPSDLESLILTESSQRNATINHLQTAIDPYLRENRERENDTPT